MAPEAFRQAGAEVIAIHAEPDGLNINDDCGATHLDRLKAAVVEHGAHLGIAVDGDADRCLAVDADGAEVDGDQIMAILALAMRDAGTLTDDTLVATVMSNLGLQIAMREAGITLVEAKVGDRYVLEELRARGLALGGEQSGHVVIPAYATTGDGVLTGLRLLARMAQTGSRWPSWPRVVTRLPQVLINVRVADKAVARARRGPRRGRRGRGPARRHRPGAAAPVRHRAAGPGDGGGVRRGHRRRRSPRASPPRSAASRPNVPCCQGVPRAPRRASSPATRSSRCPGGRCCRGNGARDFARRAGRS